MHEPPHCRDAAAAADAPRAGAAAAVRRGGRAATEAGMNLDDRLSLEESNSGRDHRSRATQVQDQAPRSSPGTPTERSQAGGAVPVSRPQRDPTRDATAAAGDQQARADGQRRHAERELARALRLPADTRLAISVDRDDEQVRFQIFDRASGKLLREVPPDENKPLLEKLKEFAGAFVDRSL